MHAPPPPRLPWSCHATPSYSLILLFSHSLVLLPSYSLVLLFSHSLILSSSCPFILLFSYSFILLFSYPHGSLILSFSWSTWSSCPLVLLFSYSLILLFSHSLSPMNLASSKHKKLLTIPESWLSMWINSIQLNSKISLLWVCFLSFVDPQRWVYLFTFIEVDYLLMFVDKKHYHESSHLWAVNNRLKPNPSPTPPTNTTHHASASVVVSQLHSCRTIIFQCCKCLCPKHITQERKHSFARCTGAWD